MHKKYSFWCHFEESIEQLYSASEKTQTRGREEPDQDLAVLSGTLTKTSIAREEPDQDPRFTGFSTFPQNTSPANCNTMTATKSREEPDQDESSRSYSTIPQESCL